MKTCLICFAACDADALTCLFCGEASWSEASSEKTVPPKKWETTETSAPPPKGAKGGKGAKAAKGAKTKKDDEGAPASDAPDTKESTEEISDDDIVIPDVLGVPAIEHIGASVMLPDGSTPPVATAPVDPEPVLVTDEERAQLPVIDSTESRATATGEWDADVDVDPPAKD